MRIAFFGTPGVAVGSLAALAGDPDIDVVTVVTNPDRARGRSGVPQPPPVKVAAIDLGIEVWQPQRPAAIAADLASLRLDAAAVVAYGAILPSDVLGAVAKGFVNLHFSLLPRWRGAAPVQHALRAGDTRTGVTTFVLDAGMDTGPILRQLTHPIAPDDTAGDLLDALAAVGAPLLRDSLTAWLDDTIAPRPQPAAGATLAPRIDPADCAIDWRERPRRIVDLVRASNPAPGAHTTDGGARVKVWRARPAGPGEAGPEAAAGTVTGAADDGPVVRAGDGAVVITEIQPAGRARMPGAAFVHGYQPEGRTLGT